MKTSYTIKEVAELLGCSTYLALKMIDSANITVYRLGRQRKGLIKGVEAYLKGGLIHGFDS